MNKPPRSEENSMDACNVSPKWKRCNLLSLHRMIDQSLTNISTLQNRKLMPKFILKEMESLYIEELKSSINLLMANLESLPVSKGSMDSKYGFKKRYNHRSQGSLAKLEGDSADSDTQLTKMDVVLTFQLEVSVEETAPYKVFCKLVLFLLSGRRDGSQRSQIISSEQDSLLHYGSRER